MIDEVTAGAKVKLREKISDSVPIGSIKCPLCQDKKRKIYRDV